MHKKIDHVPTVRRAPAIRSELAKQRRLRLQQLEDLSVDAAARTPPQRRSGRSHTGETQSDSGIR
jgi:hypothetical protein